MVHYMRRREKIFMFSYQRRMPPERRDTPTLSFCANRRPTVPSTRPGYYYLVFSEVPGASRLVPLKKHSLC